MNEIALMADIINFRHIIGRFYEDYVPPFGFNNNASSMEECLPHFRWILCTYFDYPSEIMILFEKLSFHHKITFLVNVLFAYRTLHANWRYSQRNVTCFLGINEVRKIRSDDTFFTSYVFNKFIKVFHIDLNSTNRPLDWRKVGF